MNATRLWLLWQAILASHADGHVGKGYPLPTLRAASQIEASRSARKTIRSSTRRTFRLLIPKRWLISSEL